MSGDLFLFSRLIVFQGGWHFALLTADISPTVSTSRSGGDPSRGRSARCSLVRVGCTASHVALRQSGGSEQEQAGIKKGQIKVKSSWIYW